MEPARPAKSELANQLNNMGELLRDINATGDAGSAGMKEEVIYAPLRQILSNMTANALSQPGVSESLKDLKKIIQADRNADDTIIVRIESLASLSNVAPAVKEAPAQFVKITSKDVDIQNDLVGQLRRSTDNIRFYQHYEGKSPASRQMETLRFGSEPIETIIEQLRALPEATLRNIISQPGVKEAFNAAREVIRKDSRFVSENFVQKLEGFSQGFGVKEAPPKSPDVAPKNVEPPSVKELPVKFTRIQVDDVNIYRDLPGQLQKLIDNIKFYQQKPELPQWQADMFGFEPLERSLDLLSRLSEAESQNLISQPGVKEAFIAAYALAAKEQSEHPQLVLKLGEAIRRFAPPKAQPAPEPSSAKPAAAGLPVSNKAVESKQVPQADVGRPSREDQSLIDEIQGLTRLVQNQDKSAVMNVNYFLTSFEPFNSYHPQVVTAFRELFDAWTAGNERKYLLEEFEQTLQKFDALPPYQPRQESPAAPLRELFEPPIAAFEPPPKAQSEAVAAPPQADVLNAALSSGYIEGQPSREERGKIDQLAGFIGAVQRGNHSEDFLMNISIGISDIPPNPHPEVGVLLKELAEALKGVKDRSNMNNAVVDRLERKLQQFGVPPAAAQPARAPERAEVPAAAQPARPPVVDEQAALEKSLAGLELIDQQVVRFFAKDMREAINEPNDRDFVIVSGDLLRELESKNIDVLLRLPNLELIDQMTARIRRVPGNEALAMRWEELVTMINNNKIG